ncbi:hypothetical protein [Dechloromonas denitrificans]|uniref:hypothetical protein n=1 Tax=Dechloromonas denitrificans TaxID=281362 RepID=UPI001CF903A6|nr:hypothetical protein [Dechloromonas denitrificans]UCV02156.1 hypothetical protein KI611_13740 [Dechloromonas denitrificans]UCV06500.1 hypothetical protein KI615_13870 [Dechloromonas denitrificans]
MPSSIGQLALSVHYFDFLLAGLVDAAAPHFAGPDNSDIRLDKFVFTPTSSLLLARNLKIFRTSMTDCETDCTNHKNGALAGHAENIAQSAKNCSTPELTQTLPPGTP